MRKEIAPGIILEKIRNRDSQPQTLVYKIETQIFNAVSFEIDFTGSKNIRLDGQNNMIKQTTIPPFTKKTVARLELLSSWSLKMKFVFKIELPSLPDQKIKLNNIIKDIEEKGKRLEILSNRDSSYISDSDLEEYLADKECSYFDHEFPPIDESIHSDPEYLPRNLKCIGHWRRVKFLFYDHSLGKKIDFNMDKKIISPEYIEKGDLDNDWLVSVIAALAERPKAIERLFISHGKGDSGFYKMKLCVMSRWSNLCLDDYFPCYPLGEPIFLNCSKKQLWPMLIEKAFAKLNGGYNRLKKGNCKKAFIDMTGCPTFTINFDKETINNLTTDNELSKLIKQWEKSRAIVLAVTRNQDLNTKKSERGYGVSKVFRLEKIIELKNYLGEKQFNHKLSQGSENWTSFLIEQIKPRFDEGMIYLTYQEFFTLFKGLVVCKLKKYVETAFKGKFVKLSEQDNKSASLFSSKWFYCLNLKEPTSITIGIHQQDDNLITVKETNPNTDLGLAFFTMRKGKFSLVKLIETKYEREIYHEIELDVGNTYVIPISSGIILNNEIYSPPFKIRDTINLTDFNLKPELFLQDLDDSKLEGIINDIFEKFDIDENYSLSLKELNSFYELTGNVIDEDDFKHLLSRFSPIQFPSLKKHELTKDIFSIIFKDLIQKLDEDDRYELLDKLGYNRQLVNIRNRVFRITFQSKNHVEVKAEDALKHGIDLTILRLILKNYGVNQETNEKEELRGNKVLCLYHYNK